MATEEQVDNTTLDLNDTELTEAQTHINLIQKAYRSWKQHSMQHVN